MRKVQYKEVGDGYEATASFTYTSPRYNRTVTVPKGFFSDGATWAPDIDSDSWWFHDVFCRYGVWDDGAPVTNRQASNVLSDILKAEGHPVEAEWWGLATLMFGGGAARHNKEEEAQ